MPPTPFLIIVQLIRNWQKEREEKLDLEHDLVMEKDLYFQNTTCLLQRNTWKGTLWKSTTCAKKGWA